MIAFVAALNLDDVYSNAKKCTDSISSEYGGFETLNDTINDVESNTIINLIIQCVMMVIYIYGTCSAVCLSFSSLPLCLSLSGCVCLFVLCL